MLKDAEADVSGAHSRGSKNHEKRPKMVYFRTLRLKYKTEVFLARGKIFMFIGAYAKDAVRTASNSYSENFNMNLLD